MEVQAVRGAPALARFMTDLVLASSRPAGADLTTELASTDAGELMVLLRINKGRRCVLKLNQARKFTAALLNTEIMPDYVRQFADVLGQAARTIQTIVDEADAIAPHRRH